MPYGPLMAQSPVLRHGYVHLERALSPGAQLIGKYLEPPEPRILGLSLWLFVDSVGYLRRSRLQTLVACGRLQLSGRVFTIDRG